jgi:hypothetical protein
MTCAMVFPLSSHPSFGQIKWPRESTTFVHRVRWPCVWKLRLIDRPPEWPLVKLSRPTALSVWAVHPCRLYSAHSVRMSDGRTANSDCRPLLSSPLENIRWMYGREKRSHSCLCRCHEGIARVGMWRYTSNHSWPLNLPWKSGLPYVSAALFRGDSLNLTTVLAFPSERWTNPVIWQQVHLHTPPPLLSEDTQHILSHSRHTSANA